MTFLDANIFMYAAGKPSPQRDPCRALLKAVAAAGSAYCTDTEVLQEILHRYRRLEVPHIGFALFDSILHLGLHVLPVEIEDLRLAREALEAYPTLPTRDALHAGVMQRAGIERIATYDRDFAQLGWIKIIIPSASGES